MNKAEQTKFWEGDFGNEYTVRNDIDADDRVKFFKKIAALSPGTISICELGANKGHNLQSFAKISKNFKLTGVELNKQAFEKMNTIPEISAIHSSIQDFKPNESFDLVFTCGVMIHLPPQDLPDVYKKMFELSSRYVMINEYFNPSPTEIPYRDHTDRLFKRDFGGEFMDAFKDNVRLIDYGFLWSKVEPTWDNTTWWLFEKF